jgi:hypothetical protein
VLLLWLMPGWCALQHAVPAAAQAVPQHMPLVTDVCELLQSLHQPQDIYN